MHPGRDRRIEAEGSSDEARAPLGRAADPDLRRREILIIGAGEVIGPQIFALVLEHRCLSAVALSSVCGSRRAELRRFPAWRVQSGADLARHQIHHLLTGPVCRGEIRDRGPASPGADRSRVAPPRRGCRRRFPKPGIPRTSPSND